MFYCAVKFNQPLYNWNVLKVKDMCWMFCYAESFNQPLNNWNVSIKNMNGMFDYTPLEQHVGISAANRFPPWYPKSSLNNCK